MRTIHFGDPLEAWVGDTDKIIGRLLDKITPEMQERPPSDERLQTFEFNILVTVCDSSREDEIAVKIMDAVGGDKVFVSVSPKKVH